MRNLKKILALVLALVMSLSLMATAGAKDFGDSDQVNANYKTAIDVLSELKVFGGYDDGTFKPQQNITRAEVAAIIYRIATGDVMGDKVALYSDMTNSKLADLNQAEWARGQINYCYNAGIIKGVNNTDFEPNANVTGYAALTMILRALGYGQNGEFVGDQWEMNTASRARELGLLDKISEGQLGQPATREMVAEILFRTMLKETVTWTALQGYQTTGTTLGYQTFKLRDITGVVVANQWANLNGSRVLSADTTDIVITGEEKSTRIDLDTELTDIGEARHFYLTGAVGAKEAKFIAMDEEGVNNTVYSNAGAKTDISTTSKFSKVTGMSEGEETEYYLNFNDSEKATSKILIRYVVTARSINGLSNSIANAATKASWINFLNDNASAATVTLGDGTTTTEYTRSIRPNTRIMPIDLAIMEEIFYGADRVRPNPSNSVVSGWVDGEVYTGTSSLDDKSDDMSWEDFRETYIEDSPLDEIESVVNGEWLKVVDNNNDGVAEYVFKTEFFMDKAIGTHTERDGSTVLDFSVLNPESDDYSVRWIDEVNVDDVVVYTVIDSVAIVTLAEIKTDKVVNINFKNTTITLESESDPRGQSEIDNYTDLQEIITNMKDETEYNMYLDKFGYVRAYELPGGTHYGLVTEAYYGFNKNGAFQQSNSITVELAAGEESGTKYVPQEYQLSNPGSARNGNLNPLVANDYYSYLQGRNNIILENYLRPAQAHLGTSDASRTVPTMAAPPAGYNYWDPQVNNQVVRNITAPAANVAIVPFDYTDHTNARWLADAARNHVVSLTNVAVYDGLTEDSVNLYGAAKYATDNKGDELWRVATSVGRIGTTYAINDRVSQADWQKAWSAANTGSASAAFASTVAAGGLTRVYAVDYIQLDYTDSIAKGARHYEIDPADPTYISTGSTHYVNAVHATEYYIVDGSGAYYFTDYANVPAIDAEKIHAAYAVAKNTTANSATDDYWVAEVIVIEVDEWDEADYHSIALAYFNTEENTGRVRTIETLNNTAENVDQTMIPGNLGWGTEWQNYGFYRVYDAEANDDGVLEAGSIRRITAGNYNANGIYAASVKSINSIENGGGYIDVTMYGYGNVDEPITKAPAYVVGSRNAVRIHLQSGQYSDVQVGDDIIFVLNNAKDKAAFIVDVSKDIKDYLAVDSSTPSWLADIFSEVVYEQQNQTTGNITLKVIAKNGTTNEPMKSTKLSVPAGTTSVTIAASTLDRAGYAIGGVYSTSDYSTTEITVSDGKYTFTLASLTDNTIYVKYTPVTYSLTIDAGTSGARGIVYSINGGSQRNYTAAITSGLKAGDVVTIGFTDGEYKKDYQWSIDSGVTKKNVTSNTFNVEITGAVTVNLYSADVPKASVAENAALTDVVTLSDIKKNNTTTTLPASNLVVGDKITFTAATDVNTNKIVYMYYTVDNQQGINRLTPVNGVYTIEITQALFGKSISINAFVVPETVTVSFDVAANVPTLNISGDQTGTLNGADGDFDIDGYTGSLLITSTGAAIEIAPADETAKNPVIEHNDAKTVWTVKNVEEDVTLNVTVATSSEGGNQGGGGNTPAPAAVTALTPSVTPAGVIGVNDDNGTYTATGALKYAVLDDTVDTTAWNVETTETEINTAISDTLGVAPTVTNLLNNKYLLVVDIDNNKAVAAGVVKIENVTKLASLDVAITGTNPVATLASSELGTLPTTGYSLKYAEVLQANVGFNQSGYTTATTTTAVQTDAGNVTLDADTSVTCASLTTGSKVVAVCVKDADNTIVAIGLSSAK